MHPRAPAHVQPYVDALGPATAVEFFLEFGGAELSIPHEPRGQSRLVAVLGMPAARALSALAARTVLPRRVPIPKPWIARYLKVTGGLSHAEIARKLHASDVAVRRWIAGMADHDADDWPKNDPDQPRLF
jgi:hypothetical protein